MHRVPTVAACLIALAMAAPSRGDSSHAARAATDEVRTTTTDVVLADVELMRADRAQVRLPAALDDGRPVVLNFIFTSCTAICPLMSQTLASFARKLGEDAPRVHLVSISIDPEQDTPERLSEYAARFHAGPEWTFYTGTLNASIAAQRAFGVYRGDKMGHLPIVFMRRSPGTAWRRVEGFATADDLLTEFRALVPGG